MGTPPQKVNFYFNLYNHDIFITENGCKNINLFNKNKSSTFKIQSEVNPLYENIKNNYLLTDVLYFYDNISLNNKLKIDFYPFYSSTDNYTNNELCGVIGLSLIQFEENKPDPIAKKFINEMKKYGIEKNDDFSFFHYNNQDFLVNEIFLFNHFPNIFKDIKQLEYVYPALRRNSNIKFITRKN